ncbi:family S53 protease [Mucidula mucida]|nr:family S53 protease [Mucidula mucida]
MGGSKLVSLAVTFVLASSAAWARPTRRAMAVHEQISGDTITLRIALAQNDMTGLEEALYSVSTPGSSAYGQYLSKAEVKAFAEPKEGALEAVSAWLAENDVPDSAYKTTGAFDDWVSLTLPVSQANALFDTAFAQYVHVESGERMIRTLEYSLPEDLFEFVELVHPTTSFARISGEPLVEIPVPVAKREIRLDERANPAPSSCATVVTPACLQALYAIPTTPATTDTELGVLGFIDQWANQADLKSFLAALRTDINSSTAFTLETLDGGQNPQGTNQAGVEANLDIQYTVGVATGVPVVFISVGDDNTDGVSGFIDVFDYLTAEDEPPAVISTSYGFNEPELSSSLLTRMCNGYMALGARGVSILFASGDGGVSGVQSQSCTTFVAEFPSGCPYQTSVGATTGVTEVVATFTGGGFSNFFARPSYQDADVSAYLTTLGSTYSGKYNASGRGFPDIAAQGQRLEIFYQGSSGLVSGTSASTPIFASVISLINDRLVAAGKPVLGFLNPFIYANPQAFFDITSGSNPGCNTNGFSAGTGWDPTTGLGTPNFDALLTAAGL